MAVLWLFCPEIRRVCIFSSPLDGRCHSQLKLEFQGFPGVEWWAPFQFLLSSVLLLLWHYKAMRALFLLLSTIALVALHKKSSYTFVVQGQKSTIDLQSITDTIKLWALTKLSLETRLVYKHPRNDNGSVPTSQHHCIGSTTQKSSYTLDIQCQKST